MADANNMRDTIVPKSDQMNADDLLAGPVTVTVAGVARGDKEQPVSIRLTGDRQPYKPCKSMRRVLIAAWGDDGAKWVGRSMTLFCDPSVMFGGVKVGGIRISHLSDIDSTLALALTVTRGKREPYRVEPLRKAAPAPTLDEILATLGVTMDDADRWRAANSKPAISTATPEDRAKIAAYFNANPPFLAKTREWFAANPRPEAAAEEPADAPSEDVP